MHSSSDERDISNLTWELVKEAWQSVRKDMLSTLSEHQVQYINYVQCNFWGLLTTNKSKLLSLFSLQLCDFPVDAQVQNLRGIEHTKNLLRMEVERAVSRLTNILQVL